MPFYTAPDNCKIFYETFGSKGPKILLIPGLGGDGRFFKGVIDQLSSYYQITVVDHRGAGRSDRPEMKYTIKQLADDVAGIISAEKSNYHVVGHSTGGAIVQTLALDHDNFGLSYTISSSWARSDERFRTLFIARALLLESGQTEAYQRLTHVFGHESFYLEENVDQFELAVENSAKSLAPLTVATSRVRMLLDHNRLDDLSQVRKPTMIIAAKSDILTPPTLSICIADKISNAKVKIVDGAHFHPLTRPKQFADVLTEFIKNI